jgi:hypothetical protein
MFGALLLAAMVACSSESPLGAAAGSGGSPGGSGSGGAAGLGGAGTSGDAVLGTFTVALNPAVDQSISAFTTVSGSAYSGEYPTDVIETPVASEGGCTTYQFSRHDCSNPVCTGGQKCAGPEECREAPELVDVGTVTVEGIGGTPLTLSAINKKYQYPLDLPYPGFDEGANLTLSASGGFYPPFTVTTTGVAPVALRAETFELASGTPLLVEWEAGSNAAARVSLSLNISRHGGSAGYLECEVTDTGSFTIPAGPITRLIELGVAGFPQLTLTRSTQAEVAVSGGKIALRSVGTAVPTLTVEGVCSCFDSTDCGACDDTARTVCDSVRKVCLAP